MCMYSSMDVKIDQLYLHRTHMIHLQRHIIDLAFRPALPPENTRLHHQLPRLLPRQSIHHLSRVPRRP
jgi:hypothetical protein